MEKINQLKGGIYYHNFPCHKYIKNR